MLHIALYQPQIPPNTGNIIRLCSNTGFQLHLIKPYGFYLDDKRLRRAGLDYDEWAKVKEHESFAAFIASGLCQRIIAVETCGVQRHSDFAFAEGDALLLGSETTGLPADVLNQLPSEYIVRIPMLAHNRSLNLSNATAIVAYEAWRQLGYSHPE